MTEQERYVRYLQALQDLASEMRSLVDASAPETATGSMAAHELATSRSPALVETALSQGRILAVAVRDHLEALLRSLAEPALTVAPWSNARSALESAALGCWLLDPTIGAVERVSRSLAFRYEGARQQATLARAAQNSEGIAKSKARVEWIVEEAKAIGYAEILDRKGTKRLGIGQPMPSLTDLTETVLRCGVTYKIYSAVVHAHPWALQQLTFLAVSDDAGHPQTVPGHAGKLHLFRKGVPVEALKAMVSQVGRAFHETHLREWKLFGRDVGAVEELLVRFGRELQS